MRERCFIYRFVAALMLLMFVAGCDEKQQAEKKLERNYEVAKEYTRGPLSVKVQLEKAELSLADTVHVRAEARVEQGYNVVMPMAEEFLDGQDKLGVINSTSQDDKLLEDGKVLLVREYRLEPFATGEVELPAMKFGFVEKKVAAGDDQADKEPKKAELLTKPIAFTVVEFQGKGELADIADVESVVVKPLYQRMRENEYFWWYLAGGVLLLVVVVVLVKVFSGREQTKQELQLRRVLGAHELAMERLNKLVAEDLLSAGKVKDFYVRINLILRRYVEDRFEMHAPDQTSEEFLQELNESSFLSNEHKRMLRDYMGHCDMVKFALYEPGRAEVDRTVALTKEFVWATKADEKKVVLIGQAEAK